MPRQQSNDRHSHSPHTHTHTHTLRTRACTWHSLDNLQHTKEQEHEQEQDICRVDSDWQRSKEAAAAGGEAGSEAEAVWMESDTAGEQRLGSARRQKSSLTALCVPHAVVIAIIVIYNNIKQRCPEQPIANIAPHPHLPHSNCSLPCCRSSSSQRDSQSKRKNSPLVITRNKNQLGISAFFFVIVVVVYTLIKGILRNLLQVGNVSM